MCLGVPAVITEVHDAARATVEIGGVARMISTDLLVDENLTAGDWVLVHVGFAMSKIDEEEARLSLQQIKQLGGDAYEDELESFSSSQIN
ncbi:HypC/HybG/HupF family hydrogenase formation chaperone [Corynebacterium amycolatum]|uniref:HypC/HybG/HupF family hydrogenase formation chaperone n=1 Tax=Corynebacterium amycolatum TaxID=43765 RepID=UPI0012B976EB|nr:HypC/HybG/HupF family hydrogenase formation chaperone [Corynebacterium amycolatum]KAA9288563.1 HypC/HybG/HupF family hydrogenase formation chaperone [Corynebacterium amycolatum]QQU97655.1 HypC/HybG/HupF family hydrogenase formation chaperone [Corynebacterium amycolatum]